MDNWATLELAPWRGLHLSPSALLDSLHGAARHDPAIRIFRIHDGAVTPLPPPDVAPTAVAQLVDARAATFGAFLQDVVAEHRIDCTVHLGVSMADRGADGRHAPLFCFCKLRDDRSILVPDLDFVTSGFYAADAYRDRHAFAAKAAAACFVGATTNGIVTMDRVRAGAHPRIRAAQFFRDAPGVTFEISSIVQCDSEETRDAVARLVPVAPRWRSWDEQFGCRYLLAMDGNGATWSRTAVALSSNGVLVRYASPYLLYYYRGLEPWVHYIPIRRDRDVLDLVAEAARTADRDAQIADAGRRFAARHLSRDAVTAYMAALLRAYAALLRAD